MALGPGFQNSKSESQPKSIILRRLNLLTFCNGPFGFCSQCSVCVHWRFSASPSLWHDYVERRKRQPLKPNSWGSTSWKRNLVQARWASSTRPITRCFVDPLPSNYWILIESMKLQSHVSREKFKSPANSTTRILLPSLTLVVHLRAFFITPWNISMASTYRH